MCSKNSNVLWKDTLIEGKINRYQDRQISRWTIEKIYRPQRRLIDHREDRQISRWTIEKIYRPQRRLIDHREDRQIIGKIDILKRKKVDYREDR